MKLTKKEKDLLLFIVGIEYERATHIFYEHNDNRKYMQSVFSILNKVHEMPIIEGTEK